MTIEQDVALAIRVGAALVWIAYLVRTSHRELRIHEATLVVLLALYTGAQAYRAITSPGTLLVEFTVISAVALVAGLALLLSPRR